MHGIDLLNLQRIVRLAQKYSPLKLQTRILSSLELQNVPKISSVLTCSDPWIRYIGLSWAAKEALYKACSPYAFHYSWKDASVVKVVEFGCFRFIYGYLLFSHFGQYSEKMEVKN
ncbi:hypothetical protein HMI56_002030 [Coelomomyces lativittatus]|nr:hypothetical protein HMI56_002030 [Coelomomyces lativittatus]